MVEMEVETVAATTEQRNHVGWRQLAILTMRTRNSENVGMPLWEPVPREGLLCKPKAAAASSAWLH